MIWGSKTTVYEYQTFAWDTNQDRFVGQNMLILQTAAPRINRQATWILWTAAWSSTGAGIDVPKDKTAQKTSTTLFLTAGSNI